MRVSPRQRPVKPGLASSRNAASLPGSPDSATKLERECFVGEVLIERERCAGEHQPLGQAVGNGGGGGELLDQCLERVVELGVGNGAVDQPALRRFGAGELSTEQHHVARQGTTGEAGQSHARPLSGVNPRGDRLPNRADSVATQKSDATATWNPIPAASRARR